MTLLPIVARELRVAARRPWTYRTRLWAALGGMLFALWNCLDVAWQGSSSATQGQLLFYTLSVFTFAYCLFIGARTTADCISEEKREGTLGLLFLTDLRGVDIVMGKLVASSLNAIYGLLAVLPLLAMPLLLGGVTFTQFNKMVLVLLNALFFSLSTGVFVSAISRNERKAMIGTILAVVTPAALPFSVLFFLVVVLDRFQSPRELMDLFPFLIANPVYSFVVLMPIPWPPFLAIPGWTLWASLGVVHAASWLLLLGTSSFLPRIWKDRTPAPTSISRRWSELWRRWCQGTDQARKRLRVRLLARHPILWLVSRDRMKPVYAWFFLASMVGVWAWGYLQHREVMFDFYPLVPTIILIHAFLKVWVISEVSHRLVDDQRHGALELLLSTPLTLADIVQGQKIALWRQFSLPVLALAAIELVVFRSVFSVREILPVLIVLGGDLITLMWVAMRLSLVARSINEVLWKSFFWVLLLPWLVYWGFWPLWAALMRWTMHGHWRPTFHHRLYFWFMISLLDDLLLILCWARPQLLAAFRGVGSARPAAPWRWASGWVSGRLHTDS